MSTITNAVIQKTRAIDPALADALVMLAREQDRIAGIIDPAPVVQTKVIQAKLPAPPNVTTFDYELTSRSIVLTWEAPTVDVVLYEIRLGSDWDTAERILTTGTLEAVLDPKLSGTYTFLIKALNSDGIYSIDVDSVSVIIPAIGSLTLSSSLLDTFVLLTWTEPDSVFSIDYYIVKKGGIEFARIKSTFLATQEQVGGTFTYTVTAYDIAGNASPIASNTVLVPAPGDFILRHEFESAFAGTKVSCLTEDNEHLLVCVNIVETWSQHFSTRVWTNIQDQLNAGYPLYIQPVPTTASYKETFDIGTIYTNTIINLSYLYTLISGTFTVGFSTRVSDDNVSWSAANTNLSFFATSVRYIEVTVFFTGSNDKALMFFYHFHIAVNVKTDIDSGSVSALSTDASGTVVTFNKAFKDVDSITVSTVSTKQPYTVVYDFNDIPNPTSFAVYVYDATGNRASATVEWKARGIV